MPNIVIIHGMWCHPEVAETLAAELRRNDCNVFCPSLRDDSEGTDQPVCGRHSISDYAACVQRQIEEQAFDSPPVLIGHSMGGLIAQILATRIQTSGLVLLNSAAPAGINHIFWSSFRSSTNITGTPGFWNRTHLLSFKLARYALFNCLAEEKALEIYETLRPESGRCFFEIVFWWLDPNKSTRIDQLIEVPILIASGSKDRIVHPRVSKALAKRYPEATVCEFENNGHWLFHEEGSDRIFEKVSDWIQSQISTSEKPATNHRATPELPQNERIIRHRDPSSPPIIEREDTPLPR